MRTLLPRRTLPKFCTHSTSQRAIIEVVGRTVNIPGVSVSDGFSCSCRCDVPAFPPPRRCIHPRCRLWPDRDSSMSKPPCSSQCTVAWGSRACLVHCFACSQEGHDSESEPNFQRIADLTSGRRAGSDERSAHISRPTSEFKNDTRQTRTSSE